MGGGDGMSRKYIIEIEEIPFEQYSPDVFTEEGRLASPLSKERLYRAIGFHSLVFTQEQLDRLTPLEEVSAPENDAGQE